MPWSIVTKYLVWKSWHLLETKDDLEMSDKYIGHGISDETKSLVPGFYENWTIDGFMFQILQV